MICRLQSAFCPKPYFRQHPGEDDTGEGDQEPIDLDEILRDLDLTRNSHRNSVVLEGKIDGRRQKENDNYQPGPLFLKKADSKPGHDANTPDDNLDIHMPRAPPAVVCT